MREQVRRLAVDVVAHLAEVARRELHLTDGYGSLFEYARTGLGLAEEEALKFVTINPAIQLRIEDRVGSIEVGKDADLALWSGNPLSPRSRCEQTWIDGRRYFDRDEDLGRRAEEQKLRAAIEQRVLADGDGGGGGTAGRRGGRGEGFDFGDDDARGECGDEGGAH